MTKKNYYIVYRYSLDGVRSYLRVKEKKHTEVIKSKEWLKHSLDGSQASGNGHHGYCEHCMLALVTDLGYNSWSDTKCEIKGKTTVTITHKFSWTKFKQKSTKLTEEDAEKYFNHQIHKQGWGDYNFQIKSIEMTRAEYITRQQEAEQASMEINQNLEQS